MKEKPTPQTFQKQCDVPPKELANIYLSHFGVIFSNISIVGLIVGCMAALSSIMVVFCSALTVLILVMGIMVSLGTVFVIIPNYCSLFGRATKVLEWFPVAKLFNAALYIIPISMALSVVSIVMLAFDKQKKHIGRIVFSSIVLGLLLIVFIALLVKGGVQ